MKRPVLETCGNCACAIWEKGATFRCHNLAAIRAAGSTAMHMDVHRTCPACRKWVPNKVPNTVDAKPAAR